ncbi:hypothetical protein TNCV_1329701 [Trichonephila clavipes]|nr:hypothetical protein TNCV_1329701 [Trichonephila clavipes]
MFLGKPGIDPKGLVTTDLDNQNLRNSKEPLLRLVILSLRATCGQGHLEMTHSFDVAHRVFLSDSLMTHCPKKFNYLKTICIKNLSGNPLNEAIKLTNFAVDVVRVRIARLFLSI